MNKVLATVVYWAALVALLLLGLLATIVHLDGEYTDGGFVKTFWPWYAVGGALSLVILFAGEAKKEREPGYHKARMRVNRIRDKIVKARRKR